MEGINKLLYIQEKDDVADSQDGNLDFINDWFLMGSGYNIILILVPYWLFVLKFGRNYMKNREPYKLTTLITLYNAVQVIISCFLVYGATSMLNTYGYFPKTCVMETENRRRRLAALTYYYFLAKITELLDTIFFVLRKKEKQLSFLHIYHHSLMASVPWVIFKYEASYRLIFIGQLNSFVHVIMYTYYALASYPSLAKYLWWKKYITSMQLIQFMTVFVHFIVSTKLSDCSISYTLTAALFFHVFFFLYLFGKFYVDTYKKKQKSKSTEEVTQNGDIKQAVDDTDKQMYQNGKINSVEGNGDCKSASINLNNTYRIKFNLESKKRT
ncbi:unnamed protein product [Chrysodeixis includens]|uniref:Elongation of very long chain fatty acids protein n=1 Tax=Chrysodeixis includens TaxID=689277 RepID=A0A9P0C5A1_CHRIL|nr:unnamed protein product [Chrysodeixis includens]